VVSYADMQRRVHKTGFPHAGKTILLILLMEIVCIFIAAHLYSFAIRIGLSTSTAARLPSYGFFVGLALGLASRMVRSVRDILSAFLAMAVLGGVFWFIGVLLESLLIASGIDPDIASWISRIAFWLGVLIGFVTLYAFVRDMVDSLAPG
jgi:hypothetical protein